MTLTDEPSDGDLLCYFIHHSGKLGEKYRWKTCERKGNVLVHSLIFFVQKCSQITFNFLSFNYDFFTASEAGGMFQSCLSVILFTGARSPTGTSVIYVKKRAYQYFLPEILTWESMRKFQAEITEVPAGWRWLLLRDPVLAPSVHVPGPSYLLY